MPDSIRFGAFTHRGMTYRTLRLDLDAETDPTGWIDAVAAINIVEFPVSGDNATWTFVEATTNVREGDRIDWHVITVGVRRDVRPLAEGRAVTG